MIWYIGISLLANIFLWFIVAMCWKYVKTVTLGYDTKFYMMATILLLIICGVFYIYSLCSRDTIYAMDYATYFTLQNNQFEGFKQGWFEQIKFVIKSVWYNDYNSFMCVWGGIWYVISPIKCVEAYIFEVFLWAIVPIVFLIAIFIIQVISLIGVKHPKSVFSISLIVVCFFPLFHASLLQGMPDVFGLFWAFAIINIIFSYDMKKLQFDKNIMLVLCSIALFITRRWYAFWVVGFYVSFVLLKLLKGIKEEHSIKVYAKTITTLILSGGVMACICLFPMFRRILSNNYAKNYSAYKNGGVIWETINQIEYVGMIFAVLMVIGLVIGIYKSRIRFMTLIFTATWISVTFLFTRIQNAGFHQSLLFFPTYSYMIIVVIAGADLIKWDKLRVLCQILLCLIAGINCIHSIIKVSDTLMFTKLNLKPPIREDIGEIRQVTQYIKDELIVNDETLIYIVPHNTDYNPNVFSNAFLPGELQNNIPYGAGVIGAHKFPIEFLEADYIMTSNPSGEGTDRDTIVNSLNKCLDYLASKGTLEEIRRFEHNDNMEFIFYKKVNEIDIADIDAFEVYFSKLSEEYPALYNDVLESYKEKLK